MTAARFAPTPPPEHPPEAGGSLWQAFARGVRDNVVAEVAVQAIRLGGLVILLRALTPGDFGIYKVLLIITAFGTLYAEAGIPDALIQRKVLRPDHHATAWWFSVASAVGTSVALYYGAPLLARAEAMPELTRFVRLLCIPLALEGLTMTANARLRRAIRFTALAAADVIAEVIFLIVALYLLWIGKARWSLPGGLAAKYVAHALIVWSADPWIPLGMPRVAAVRDLGRFAASVWVGRLIIVAASNVDYLLVGRLLGSAALGFYSMAWYVLQFIPDRLHRVAGRVLLPAFCRIQDDDRELAKRYRDFGDYVARIVLPIAGCVALAAPELLGGVYGPHWIPAATPLRLLTFGLALAGLRVAIGPAYYTKNHPEVDIYLNGARTLGLIGIIFALVPFGLPGISFGVSAVEAAITVAGEYVACRLISLSFRSRIGANYRGVKLACGCLLGTAIGKEIASIAGLHGFAALVLVGVPPAIIFLLAEGRDVADMVGKAFAREDSSTAQNERVVEVPGA